MSESLPVIYCVIDAKAGHATMAREIARLLAVRVGGRIEEVRFRRWSKILGKPLQALWPFGTFFSSCLLCKPPSTDKPLVVVGSGGNSLWNVAALARENNCLSVFVGSRRRLPTSAVSVFIHYDRNLVKEGTLIFPLLAFPKKSSDRRKAWRDLCAEQGLDETAAYGLCLVGGNGSGYSWDNDDAVRLAALMRENHTQTGRRWLVATSRRTHPDFERKLAEELPENMLADVCWLHSGDERRVVMAYLEGARIVLVTEDSMSMIQESLVSGKPVLTYAPQKCIPSMSHQSYLEEAEQENWLRRVNSSVLSLADVESRGQAFPTEKMESCAEELFARLNI